MDQILFLPLKISKHFNCLTLGTANKLSNWETQNSITGEWYPRESLMCSSENCVILSQLVNCFRKPPFFAPHKSLLLVQLGLAISGKITYKHFTWHLPYLKDTRGLFGTMVGIRKYLLKCSLYTFKKQREGPNNLPSGAKQPKLGED